jgi:hypothetical protein
VYRTKDGYCPCYMHDCSVQAAALKSNSKTSPCRPATSLTCLWCGLVVLPTAGVLSGFLMNQCRYASVGTGSEALGAVPYCRGPGHTWVWNIANLTPSGRQSKHLKKVCHSANLHTNITRTGLRGEPPQPSHGLRSLEPPWIIFKYTVRTAQ